MSPELIAIILMGLFLAGFILVTFHRIEHRIDERIIDDLQQRVDRAEQRVDLIEARLRTVKQDRANPKSWAA